MTAGRAVSYKSWLASPVTQFQHRRFLVAGQPLECGVILTQQREDHGVALVADVEPDDLRWCAQREAQAYKVLVARDQDGLTLASQRPNPPVRSAPFAQAAHVLGPRKEILQTRHQYFG